MRRLIQPMHMESMHDSQIIEGLTDGWGRNKGYRKLEPSLSLSLSDCSSNWDLDQN